MWQSLDYVDKQIPKKLNKKTKLSHTRATTVDGGGAGGGARWGGLPCPTSKIEKKCPDFVKNALTVSIFELNFPFKM